MQSLVVAYALLQKGDLDQAEAICRSIMAGEVDPAGYRLLAEISRLRHDLPAALRHARRGLELAPNQPDSLFCLGTLLLQSGDANGAIEHLDRAVEWRLRFDKAQDALCVALERRAKYEGRYRVSVITATTGNPKLRRAIESVQAQTYPRVEHVIVIDGPSGAENVRRMLPSDTSHDIQIMSLPFNTGAEGYNGHRIYAACIYLVNGRYVSFLDEDNWFEPHHIASLMQLVESKGLEWCYALRNIVDADGHLITQDDCESLGAWPIWNAPGTHLVDMNCYLVRRDIAIGASPVFHRRIYDGSPDFELCRFLLNAAKRFDTNGDYTVNYTAGNTALSVKSDFFTAGNRAMSQKFRGRFPWRKHGLQTSSSRSAQSAS
jgi:hypothetical protein